MRELVISVDDRWGRRAGLERALREAIRSGRLAAGSALPSSRALAADLGYSRSTVVAAYEQLGAEGYLRSTHGAGTVVSEVRRPLAEDTTRRSSPVRFDIDFRPGEPDGGLFPRRAWHRSVRHVLSTTPDGALGYEDPGGVPQLRHALADYLARSRAVFAPVGAVSIFAGFSAAVGFLGELFRERGIAKVAVEDPTLFVLRDILRLAGVTPVPIPLDEDGIDVGALEGSGARAVIVTPGHQYPMGIMMTANRRAALTDWADRVDGWIVEDDYDGEFRYDRQSIGSLQGLAPNRVIYAGTASKSLIPGLRLAWLIVPAPLQGGLAAKKHLRGMTSTLEQLTLADFIERGELDRHLRSTRTIYGKRRDTLVERLGNEVPALSINDRRAGLHLTGLLPPGVCEQTLVSAAAEVGIGLLGLKSHYAAVPDADAAESGVVLGYSRLAQHRFPSALDQLVELLGDFGRWTS